jgi:hypothetical protein
MLLKDALASELVQALPATPPSLEQGKGAAFDAYA